jgi:hypothetical protein
MKFAVVLAIVGFGICIPSVGFGQSDVGLPTNTYSTRTTGLGTNSANATGVAPSATPEERTVEGDDTLYRGRTSEDHATMLRDEGRLHFKSRGKEKVQEVDSLKNLQTTGVDPRFQGSLLHSSVASIADVAEKGAPAQNAPVDVNQRFKQKQLIFTPEKDDQPQKARSDSSPSPTPSATSAPEKRDQAKP